MPSSGTKKSGGGLRDTGPSTLSAFSQLNASQIRFLVASLNKKNFKTIVPELHHLVELHGNDAYIYLLKSLVSGIDFKDQKAQKDQQRIAMLQQETIQLLQQPNFASIVYQAFEGIEQLQEDFLLQITRILKLSFAQELLLALGLTYSMDPAVKQEALKFLRTKLKDIPPQTSFKGIPESVLHNLLYVLHTNEQFARQAQTVIRYLQKLPPPTSQAMNPLLLDSDNNSKQIFGNSIAETLVSANDSNILPHVSKLLEDLGFSICDNVNSLKEALSVYTSLTDLDVAMCLSMMVRTNGISTAPSVPLFSFPPKDSSVEALGSAANESASWHFANFVDVLKELFPELNWPNVIKQLDHPGFLISDSKGLALIMSAYRRATKEQFPVDILFGQWHNTTGQLSFIRYAVSAPPDVFNFASNNRVDIEGVAALIKAPSNLCWHSLSLLETLLRLAEIENFSVVRSVFAQPVKNCPELLILGVAQVKSTWNTMALDIASSVLPAIIFNPAATPLIQKIWILNSSLVLRGLIELHAKEPSSSLTRILEVVSILKILPGVLELRHFPFTIDLACIAARREFISLDKFLQERFLDNGEQFLRACISFLRDKQARPPNDPKLWGPDTAVAFFNLFQTHLNFLNPQQIDEIRQINPKFQSGPSNAPPGLSAPSFLNANNNNNNNNANNNPLNQLNMGNTTGLNTANLTPEQQQQLLLAQQSQFLPGVNAPMGSMPAMPPAGTVQLQPESRVFPPHIEEPANAYFQKIYTGQMSIDEVIAMLKRFRTSKDQKEQDIFACMIHNLFDEYRFFPKYPDKELLITGVLFGSLIQHQLVSYLPLGLALRYVLDALRKPPGSKMFQFGLTALEEFKSRLAEWPQYCSHLLQIPHLYKAAPGIVEFIERTHGQKLSQQQQPQQQLQQPQQQPQQISAPNLPNTPQQPTVFGPGQPKESRLQTANSKLVAGPISNNTNNVAPNTNNNVTQQQPQQQPPQQQPQQPQQQQVVSNTPTVISGNNSNINALSNATIGSSNSATSAPANAKPPPHTLIDDTTKDKIHFIFNNVSMQNLDQKMLDLKPLLATEESLEYLSYYLIVRRVSIEANFHHLYLSFLERLRIPILYKKLLVYCFDNIRVLLRSDKIISSSQERSLLKNLGSWLGSITLARNKPILHKDLPLKELIFEGYEQGRLIATIPFVCKTLEAAKNSKVFREPNPWIMAIARVLADVYRKPNLRLNLKFEIEVLFKALGLEEPKLQSTNTLQSKKQYVGPNNFDFNPPPTAEPSVTPQPILPNNNANNNANNNSNNNSSSTTQPDGQQTNATNGETLSSLLSAALSGPDPFVAHLSPYLHINASIVLFAQQPQLKRVVPLAIDRAIREIITPVVERSVTIACITTKELALKDFAMEADEEKLQKSAHVMVQNLAGSLALVTCKEPLRVSMSNHLRSLLADQTAEALHPLIEQAVQMLANENLDLACSLIEKAATEKALRDTDQALSGAYMARKKYRERMGGVTNANANATTAPFYDAAYVSGRYPSSLPEYLRPKLGGLVANQLRLYEDFGRIAHVQAANAQPELSSTQIGDMPLTIAQLAERLSNFLVELESSIPNTSVTSLAALSPDTPVLQLFKQIHPLLLKTPQEIAFSFAQKVIKKFEENPPQPPLGQDALFHLLDAIVSIHKSIVKNILTWVVEERKLHPLIVTSFTRSRVLFVPEFDQTLARLIEQSKFHENPGPHAKIPFSLAIMLFRQCMVEQRFPIVSVLPETVDILTRISRNKGGEELAKLLEEVKKFNPKSKEGVQASPSKRPTLSGSTPSLAQVLQQQGKSAPDVTSSTAFPPLGTNGVQQPTQTTQPQQSQPQQPQQPQPQQLQDKTIVGPQQISANNNNNGAVANNNNKSPVTPTQSFGAGNTLAASTDSFAVPDGPGVREDVVRQFDEWLALFSQPNQNDKSFAAYVLSAPQQNLLKEGDTTNKFFRVAAELMIERFFSSGGANATTANANNAIYFGSVDALAKLIVLFVKHCEPAQNKIPLLARILHVVVRVLMRDYETRKLDFNQRPWFRFFVNCLIDINAPDPALDAIHLQVLLAFSNALLLLSPSRLPGFAFAWLELISNRNFMPKLLNSKSQKGWPWFQRLLVELFKFLEPYLRNAYLTEPIRVLYKGTLRVLLVLLHDFPEFLCDYHVSFCDIIPHSCIQMRNLILSAFPRNLRLPDPFTPNLKVDMLPEISQPPRILSDFTVALQQGNFRAELEQYLKGQPGNFVNEPIKDKLLVSDEEAAIYGTRYHVARINALVLFVGAQAIMTKSNAQLPLTHNGPDFAIFSHLSQELDSEGRYLFFNALANQLRYPNSHTHYFGIVLLHLFEKAPADIIKEQITRVLLERLIVNRPHPWGLLITFIELIKNPRYSFWSHQFTRCAPEIERLFESVARSCMGGPTKPSDSLDGNNKQ